MDFSEALKMLKNGTKICHSDWDIDEYLFLNDDGVIEYHSRFITSSEPDIVDAEDVMATDWEAYDDFVGNIALAHYENCVDYGIITGQTNGRYNILFSNGEVVSLNSNKVSVILKKECSAIKEALLQLKSFKKDMENSKV